MLTSGSTATTATTRALLFVGMTSELLAILLAVTFAQSRPSAFLHLASGVPIVLVLTGIVGLVVALVVEMLKVSVGMAAAMSGFLAIGIILCLLALFFGAH